MPSTVLTTSLIHHNQSYSGHHSTAFSHTSPSNSHSLLLHQPSNHTLPAPFFFTSSSQHPVLSLDPHLSRKLVLKIFHFWINPQTDPEEVIPTPISELSWRSPTSVWISVVAHRWSAAAAEPTILFGMSFSCPWKQPVAASKVSPCSSLPYPVLTSTLHKWPTLQLYQRNERERM